MESLRHASNVFVTLTSSDNKVWFTSDFLPTLNPEVPQLWLKRLRKQYGGQLRFFLVGEYGDETMRPHYHAALFNFPACGRGGTLRSTTGRYLWAECCESCRLVGDTWQQGDVGIGALDGDRAGYLAGYVTKKMTKKEDARLAGRHPEFSRMSRGGAVQGSCGIGGVMVPKIARIFNHYASGATEDVPAFLKGSNDKKLPLGSYMRKKVREAVMVSEDVKNAVLHQAWAEQVLPLLEAAKTDKEAPTLRAQLRKANLPFAESLKWKADEYKRRKKGRRL